MPNENTKTCAQCGTIFVARSRDRKYCSRTCSGLAHQTLLTTTCERCGGPFQVKPSHVAKGRGRFCSKQCAYLSARTLPDATCRTCGKVYRPYGTNMGTVYCSMACRNQYVASLPQDAKEALMAGCRAATRGAKQSDEHRRKIARSRQDNCKLSEDEQAILTAYQQSGLRPVPLYAVDRYNIDFAFPDQRLAVEYDGGNWHNTPKKRAIDERKAALLESLGWTIIRLPRIDKPQNNDAGNERITLDEIIQLTREALAA